MKPCTATTTRFVDLYHDLQLEVFATSADRVKELENRDTVRRRAGVKMEFASERVALGMGRHRLSNESRDHFRLMFRLTQVAIGRSAQLVHVLAPFFLEPRFRG